MAADVISFARGAPSTDLLPADAVREAAERSLVSDWERALSYGTGRGHPGLCEWVASEHAVDPARVMITNGSLEGAALLFQHLVDAGDQVVVEHPSYDRTLLMLAHRGADRLPIALEEDGLDVAALEEALGEGATPKLVHVIPNYHNPAGCTLAEPKRRRVLALAGEFEFTIFEDDPYMDIGFGPEPLPTMLSLDEGERVVYASSFSKTISPGVRVGYLVGPEALIATLAKRANETYISPNMLAEAIVWELCRSGGLERNVAVVTDALRARRDALVEALREHLPEAEFVVPGGGYFLWLTLAEDVDTVRLLGEAKEEGVLFVPGPDFVLDGGRSSLRLSFASVPSERIPEGVARIARALERIRAASPA